MPKWNWPDARGWIGLGSYSLTVLVLVMLWLSEDLRADEYFKALATLIVGSFVKDVCGWAYQATKGGGELADKNAAIVAESATAGVAAATKLSDHKEPTEVKVVNTEDDPAKVTETHTAPAQDGRPDYAR